jgi:hypothetical protein
MIGWVKVSESNITFHPKESKQKSNIINTYSINYNTNKNKGSTDPTGEENTKEVPKNATTGSEMRLLLNSGCSIRGWMLLRSLFVTLLGRVRKADQPPYPLSKSMDAASANRKAKRS